MVVAGGLAPPGNDSDQLYRLDDEQRRRVLTALPKVAAALSRAIAPNPSVRSRTEHLTPRRGSARPSREATP